MKHLLERDKKRRQLTTNHEFKRSLLKSISSDLILSITARWKSGLDLSELPRDSSRVRSRNRCILTNRARGTHRSLRISRIELRFLSRDGKINGLKKSSW